ncbi:MAG TPA: alpha/beta fold hydrolase [Candidatus Angelobacter sp.]|nr:alpha/beta fold hydrolase [Candidatus Angelobacter sp.]
MHSVTEFIDESSDPPVRGFLHQPATAPMAAMVLTHGAGANSESKLLLAAAEAFADAGFLVLRCDLPFRQKRPHGPPPPGAAERDRDGLKRAVECVRERISGPIYLGGHSYGGRQASILAANAPELVAGLLLLSYPLHPPRRPAQLRTAHWPRLVVPALFVHGSRDPLASRDEMNTAMALLTGRHSLLEIEGAGHELFGRKPNPNFAVEIVAAFTEFIARSKRAETGERSGA